MEENSNQSKAGFGRALFIALDHTSTALVFSPKGSSTMLQEQVDVVVLLTLVAVL